MKTTNLENFGKYKIRQAIASGASMPEAKKKVAIMWNQIWFSNAAIALKLKFSSPIGDYK